MGGINCPPPPSAPWDKIPRGFLQSYISSLATYSDHLFSAIGSFYSANAMIEKSVCENSDMLLATALLETAKQEAISARNSLGTVESMWYSLDFDNDEKTLDFKAQMELLSEANVSIDTVIEIMSRIDTATPVQTQIWNEPILVGAIVAVVNIFAQAMNWQVAFATRYANQMVGY